MFLERFFYILIILVDCYESSVSTESMGEFFIGMKIVYSIIEKFVGSRMGWISKMSIV